MKQLKLMKTLLVAVGLLLGTSVWADSGSETFGADQTAANNTAIVGTSVTIAGSSNTGGIGQYLVFNNKSDKGLKLRTGSALTLNVNSGYKVTAVTVYAYQNNKTTGTITCDSYSVDGAAATNYSPAVSIPLNVENASTQSLATISTGAIEARTSIMFNFTNTDVAQNQIYAFIEVTYESLEKTIVNIPFTGTASTIAHGATYNGTQGSMTFDQPSGNAFKITTDYMIVGTGTGTTTIAEADRAGYAHKAEGKNNDIVEMTFSMVFGNTSGSTYSGFEILDENDDLIVTLMSSKWAGINASANTFGLEASDLTSQSGYNSTSWSKKTDFTLVFNYFTKQITCKTNNNPTGKTISMDDSKPVVAKFVLKSTETRGDDTRQPFFSNLVIKNIEGDYSAVLTEYTINYKAGTDVVKTVTGTDAVGETMTAETVIDGTEAGFVGNHYLITAGSAPSMTLVADAASNVLDVPVRAPYTATLTLTKTLDGVAQTPEVIYLKETDDKVCSWTYYYSKYEKDGENKYYIASDISKFGETGTFTDGENVKKTIAYTSAPLVAIFVEAESANTNSSNNENYSGGKTGYVTGGNSYSLGTLPAGTYNLSVYLESRGDRGIYLRSGSTKGTEIINLGTNNSSPAGVYNNNFTLTEATALYLTGFTTDKGNTNQCANIDYILITATSASIIAKTKCAFFQNEMCIFHCFFAISPVLSNSFKTGKKKSV